MSGEEVALRGAVAAIDGVANAIDGVGFTLWCFLAWRMFSDLFVSK